MTLNLIMLGPPGAGKGTQSERIARARGIPRISTGDILREAVHAGTEIGRRAGAIMNRGALVGDDVMIGIVRDRLNREDARSGFVLDGFPRTLVQARDLDDLLNGRGPLVVLDIAVPEVELVRRLASRMLCEDCGADAGRSAKGRPDPQAPEAGSPVGVGGAAPESTDVVKPESELRCQRCGGRFVQRTDDSLDVVRERLRVYHRQTEPLVEYYRGRPTFRAINGAQGADGVAADLVRAIEEVTGRPASRGIPQ